MKLFPIYISIVVTALTITACKPETESTGQVAATEPETTEAAASPNIIFIITDDQGWTSVSYPSNPERDDSASDYFETPNMATLASEGMRFTQAYTPAPICAPARHATLFGQRTTRHIYNRDASWIDRAPDWLTIPKAIKAANPEYRAAHFGKWHVGLKPKAAGFDFTDGLTDNEEGDSHAGSVFADINFIDQEQMDAYNKAHGIDTTPVNPDQRDRSITFYTHEDPKTAFSLTARASAFIREAVADGKPFYAHIAHYAVHTANSARKDSYARFQAKTPGAKHDDASFGAMLFDLDAAIGQIMDLVKELGIEDNTYIVVISDNGGVAHFSQTSQIDAKANILSTFRTRIPWNNTPLREGKHSYYEGGLRVPFLISGPNIKPNSHSDEPITGLDLLPTFARLAGYDGTFEGPLDGQSLVPLIDGSDETVFEREDPTLIFHQAGRRPGRSAVREGKYKLVKHWTRRSEINGETQPYTLELYDLDADIGEQNDLSATHPDIVADLHTKLLQHIAESNGEFEDNPRKDPMGIIEERDGLGSNRKERVKNREPVVVEYVSPYKAADKR